MHKHVGVLAIAAWFLGVASCSSESSNPAANTAGSPGVAGNISVAGNTGSGGSAGAPGCAAGLLSCSAACVNPQTDFQNCGACNTKCADGQSCASGKCECAAGLSACGASCINLTSDGANCGACGTACGAGTFCSQSKCGDACAAGETACGNSCINLATDATNCGFCGNRCAGGQGCSMNTCGCEGGKSTCNGVCVDVKADPANCGACGTVCSGGQACTDGKCGGGASGTGGAGGAGGGGGTGGTGAGGAPPGRNGCALKPGLISDFEEGAVAPVVVSQEERSGVWEKFNDATSMTQTLTVEASGGTMDCDKFALHVKGSGYSEWGAGIGFGLAGTNMAPKPYNATAKQFTGVRFKAKLGTTADPKSPVRFNISTPWTESKDNSGGQCTPTVATDNKSATDCYQHAGKFLAPGTGEGDLSQSWKTFTFCFDRDLYPLSLPSNLTTEQRNNIGTNILKMQFQFNQGKDYSGAYTSEYPSFQKGLPFDLWVDDVELFSGACPNMTTSPSNGSPAKAFPQNTAIGTCAPAANADKFASALAQAYARWTKNFVQNDHVVAPEQQGAITSEALGYGMMIAAAMGDKAAFDKFHGYVKANGGSGSGLMTWKNGGSGSASDGDIDIAFALLMADKQWPTGGYKAAGDSMAAAILAQDIVDGVVRGGSSFKNAPFNPSYFAPAAFRKFGASFNAAITENFRLVTANVTGTTSGIPTDWADAASGKPSGAGSAQVTSEIIDGNNGAMGYDSARVSWRLGLDVCLGGDNTTALKAIVDFFAAKYDAGASIDLMKAGWYKTNGMVHKAAKDLQASYIGPMGAGGMAMKNTVMRDRAFRTILDLLESGDFNHTYFPSTVGLLTALMMSGNFPTP
jgi:endo-1,4-beta-D-glucanase Y